MALDLKGKAAVVTGGAHGIGLGIVTNLVSQGCAVVIADINGERGQEALDKLRSAYPDAQVNFQTCDVSSWASQVAAFAGARKAFGLDRIDYVFPNAGIAQLKEFHDRTPNNFASSKAHDHLALLADSPPSMRVLDVNLNGALYSIYVALAHFRTQELDAEGSRGKIIATASNAGIYPFPCDTLYGASKTGLVGAIRSLAPRLAEEGITINGLAPAIVDTGLPLPPKAKEDGLITPMKTVTNACEIFYKKGSKVSGQIAECCLDRVVLRKFPKSLDDKARQSMDQFWKQDAIDNTLDEFHGNEAF